MVDVIILVAEVIDNVLASEVMSKVDTPIEVIMVPVDSVVKLATDVLVVVDIPMMDVVVKIVVKVDAVVSVVTLIADILVYSIDIVALGSDDALSAVVEAVE